MSETVPAPRILVIDDDNEVRYSLNSDAVDLVWKFKPSTKMFEVGEELFTSVPKTTEFACVQVTYKDGTKSDVQKVVRKAGE